MYSINDFRKINTADHIVMTLHSQLRMAERAITVDDVISAIDNGEIIEEYPDDYPFPSCLILGLSINNLYIHVVVSMDDGMIYLITAYVPDSNIWEDDLKTRRRKQP